MGKGVVALIWAASFVVHGFVIYDLWRWFAVPLGAPHFIGYGHALGVWILIAYVTGYDKISLMYNSVATIRPYIGIYAGDDNGRIEKEISEWENKKIFVSLYALLLRPVFAFIAGWLIHTVGMSDWDIFSKFFYFPY